MSIDQAASGRWRARYRDPDGRQRSKTFDRKRDAETFLAQMRLDLARGDWIDPKLGRTTVGELAQRVILTKSAPSNRDWYNAMARHVDDRWKAVPIGAVRHLDVQDWVLGLSAAGCGPDTVR